jgi:hypothetical protein
MSGEGRSAGLPGTYVAWLTSTFLAFLPSMGASALSRFNLSGPTWQRPDGIPLASSPLGPDRHAPGSGIPVVLTLTIISSWDSGPPVRSTC